MEAVEYTLGEAGALIGRSPVTLRRQIGMGRLRARRVGHIWLVSRRELIRYGTESRRPPLAPFEGGVVE